MKKIFLLLLTGISVMYSNAQKENGIVYNEHEAITKTKAMWAAFIKGDKETCLSFFADSLTVETNGDPQWISRSLVASNINWWQNVENFTVDEDLPALPVAIVYNDGSTIVEDWVIIKGIHKESGFNIRWKLHSIYRFNSNGKIDLMKRYHDNSIFEEINNSSKKIENGKVYINHPFIVTVRKLVNAYCKEDIDGIRSFFAPDAVFSTIWGREGEYLNLEKQIIHDKEVFAELNNIQFEQFGYPDCIYYAKEDSYQVFSWWILSFNDKDGKKHEKIPNLFIHSFNAEGKINGESVYVSSNHFQ